MEGIYIYYIAINIGPIYCDETSLMKIRGVKRCEKANKAKIQLTLRGFVRTLGAGPEVCGHLDEKKMLNRGSSGMPYSQTSRVVILCVFCIH